MTTTRSLTIPADATEYLENNIVFIMGAGRSGTTVLGSLLSSMRPVFYLFEPVLIRLLPFLLRGSQSPSPLLAPTLRSVLFEDYLLPLVQGRNINPNKGDKTWYGSHSTDNDIRWRGLYLNQRRKAIAWVLVEKPIWVIKLPELQVFADVLADVFPGARFIHIIRNGCDVVSSCVRLDWYTDFWCTTAAVEWMRTDTGMVYPGVTNIPSPWYLDEESRSAWPGWNPETRAACVWRTVTNIGKEFSSTERVPVIEITYEGFKACPGIHANIFSQWLNTRRTRLTSDHIASIESWEPHEYESPIPKIRLPEAERFLAFMGELGYSTEVTDDGSEPPPETHTYPPKTPPFS